MLTPEELVLAALGVTTSGAGGDAVEQVEKQREMAAGRRLPFLMDITQVRSLSREARQYYASAKAAEVFLVTALLISSPVSRAIGNVFLGLNKTSMPTRLFTSTEEALAWMREQARQT